MEQEEPNGRTPSYPDLSLVSARVAALEDSYDTRLGPGLRVLEERTARLEDKADAALEDVRRARDDIRRQSVAILRLTTLSEKVAARTGVPDKEVSAVVDLGDGEEEITLVTQLDRLRKEAQRDKHRRMMSIAPVKTRLTTWGRMAGIGLAAIVGAAVSLREILDLLRTLLHP